MVGPPGGVPCSFQGRREGKGFLSLSKAKRGEEQLDLRQRNSQLSSPGGSPERDPWSGQTFKRQLDKADHLGV